MAGKGGVALVSGFRVGLKYLGMATIFERNLLLGTPFPGSILVCRGMAHWFGSRLSLHSPMHNQGSGRRQPMKSAPPQWSCSAPGSEGES